MADLRLDAYFKKALEFDLERIPDFGPTLLRIMLKSSANRALEVQSMPAEGP